MTSTHANRTRRAFSLGGSLLLCGLAMSSVAGAMDPRLPLLEEDPGAQAKVERFGKAYKEDANALKALEASTQAERSKIHAALAASNAEYAKAFADYERSPDNADAWKAVLENSKDVYVRAHASYFLGRALLAQDDLEGAAAALESVRGRLRSGTPWTDEATFYLGYVYARLPELDGKGEQAKARAQQLLTELVGAKPLYAPPERVAEGATWLLRELRGDGMGPLLELAKRMETIERLIRRSRTGKGTQKRQEKVVASIDELIKLMREKESACSGGDCKKPGGHKPGECKKPGQPKGQKKSKSGAKESKLPTGPGKDANLHEASRDADQDGWAKLKKKEREKVEQFLKERFPTRYRELIERYFRGVSEADK